MNDECLHISQEFRKGEKGLWCIDCGMKMYGVDERQCKDCAHSRKLLNGTICNKHLMSVSPDMNVTFKIAKGSCWTAKGADTMNDDQQTGDWSDGCGEGLKDRIRILERAGLAASAEALKKRLTRRGCVVHNEPCTHQTQDPARTLSPAVTRSWPDPTTRTKPR